MNTVDLLIVVAFSLSHFDMSRVNVLGVPLYAPELGSLILFAFMITTSKFNLSRKKVIPTPVQSGILILLLSVSFSATYALSGNSPCPISPEHAIYMLGILKSWFAFPIFFGMSLFYIRREILSDERMLRLFALSFIPLLVMTAYAGLGTNGLTYDHRLLGMFNSPNTLAMHLVPGILVLWFILRSQLPQRSFQGEMPSRTTFGWLSLFIASLALLFLTRSVSAFISTACAITAVECALRFRAWKALFLQLYEKLGIYAPIAILFFIIAILAAILSYQSTDYFDPSSRSSFASRLMIWKSAISMVRDSPIFGIGPGNFGNCYLLYQKFFQPYLEWSVPQPHNIFLAFWLESGLIGLFSFLFLLVVWARHMFRKAKRALRESIVPLALISIMIATITHGLSDTPYWQAGLSYLFWFTYFLGIRHSTDLRD